jgi:hypothetical protein
MRPALRHRQGRSTPWWGLVALAVAYAAILGCAMGDFAHPDRDPCFSHQDCQPDQQCILGGCTSVPDFQVDLEIEPPPISEYLSQPVQGVDLSVAGALDVVVPLPTVVSGTLRMGMEPFQGAARLTFNAEPGLRRSLSFPIDVRGDQEEASFEVRLVGNRIESGNKRPLAYTVAGRPLEPMDCCHDEDAPCPTPLLVSGLRFSTDTPDLVLAFSERPTRIAGRVLTTAEEGAPQAAVQVQAFDEAGGTHSLPAITDEDGQFCVALALPHEGHDALVTLRVSGLDRLSPTLEQLVMVTSGQSHHEIDVHVGSYGAPVEVTGQILDVLGDPVSGASVSFTGEVTTGGRFSAVASTNDEGIYTVALLAGVYRARAVPRPESHAGAVEILDFVVDPAKPDEADSPFDRPLPDRPTLSGRVLGPGADRMPVPEVEVRAELSVSATSDGGARNRLFTTLTDEYGYFDLPLDPGEYRLHVRPPRISGLPWIVGPLVAVDAATARDLGSLVLEAASTFEGKALGQTEGGMTRPLTGAKVEVHARRHDATFLLWEGRADDDGSFEVLLPTSLIGTVEPTGSREASDDDRE